MNIDTATERYRNDATFKQAVDMMMMWIHEMHLSPSEVRDAAMFAVYRHQMMFAQPVFVTRDGTVEPTGSQAGSK